MQAKTAGFTLVELVVVMLIVGILAVTALPRFLTVDAEVVLGQRDQLLALGRQIQLQSMQDTANLETTCPALVIQTDAAGVATSDLCSTNPGFVLNDNPEAIDLVGTAVSANHGVLPSAVSLPFPLLLNFDSWGRPVGACAGGCRIKLSRQGQQADLCIAANGYQSLC